MLDARKAAALLPFGYMIATRLKSLRDWLYLGMSQWGLGLLTLLILSDEKLTSSVLHYFFGYIAFLTIYEIGYLFNDVWDAKQSANGRDRFNRSVTLLYVSVFIIIRVSIWLFITLLFFQGEIEYWATANIALSIVFICHNVIKEPGIRYATFYQLTIFRFSIPLIFSLPSEKFEQILIVSFLHYIYFRGFAYLDSKDLLAMPQRREPSFGLKHTLIMLPIVIILYLSTGSILFPAAWFYTVIMYMAVFFGLSIYDRSGAR